MQTGLALVKKCVMYNLREAALVSDNVAGSSPSADYWVEIVVLDND